MRDEYSICCICIDRLISNRIKLMLSISLNILLLLPQSVPFSHLFILHRSHDQSRWTHTPLTIQHDVYKFISKFCACEAVQVEVKTAVTHPEKIDNVRYQSIKFLILDVIKTLEENISIGVDDLEQTEWHCHDKIRRRNWNQSDRYCNRLFLTRYSTNGMVRICA